MEVFDKLHMSEAPLIIPSREVREALLSPQMILEPNSFTKFSITLLSSVARKKLVPGLMSIILCISSENR